MFIPKLGFSLTYFPIWDILRLSLEDYDSDPLDSNWCDDEFAPGDKKCIMV